MPRRRADPAAVTLAAVARACGVALSTASKALNPHLDRCDLNPETRARVLAAAAALGYRRDAQASANARRRHGAIGLAWGRAAPRVDGVYERLVNDLADALQGQGYRLLFVPAASLADWRAAQLAQRLDGVIAVEWLPDEVLAELEAQGYPAVLLNLATPRRLHQVLADDRAGAEALASHLAGLGHRRLVYVPAHEPPGRVHDSAVQRWAGLEALAAARGLDLVRTGPHDLAAAVAACGGRSGATAVVTYQYADVAPLYERLAAAGLAVPARVSVASFQDVGWYRLLAPPVTALAVPMAAMAARAAGRLAAILAPGPGARPDPAVERLPVDLRLRASTASPPGSGRKRFRKRSPAG